MVMKCLVFRHFHWHKSILVSSWTLKPSIWNLYFLSLEFLVQLNQDSTIICTQMKYSDFQVIRQSIKQLCNMSTYCWGFNMLSVLCVNVVVFTSQSVIRPYILAMRVKFYRVQTLVWSITSQMPKLLRHVAPWGVRMTC